MKINLLIIYESLTGKLFVVSLLNVFLIFVCYSLSLLNLDLFYGNRITKSQ